MIRCAHCKERHEHVADVKKCSQQSKIPQQSTPAPIVLARCDCGRKLTHPRSVAAGIGPVCARKIKLQVQEVVVEPKVWKPIPKWTALTDDDARLHYVTTYEDVTWTLRMTPEGWTLESPTHPERIISPGPGNKYAAMDRASLFIADLAEREDGK